MKISLLRLVRCALLTALIIVCSWITIPSAVPFTLQTMAVFCALVILGGRDGTLSILLYLLLGMVGLPVFSGFKGGIAALAGATGGYLIGFLVQALVYWLLTARRRTACREVFALVLGLLLCYAFGTAWFLIIYTRTAAVSLLTVFAWCVFPFILPDLFKLLLAYSIGKRVRVALLKR